MAGGRAWWGSKVWRLTPKRPAFDAMRPSTLYLSGPEKISQTRIKMYSTSGSYRKSSSQARTPLAWMVDLTDGDRGDHVSHEHRGAQSREQP